MYEPYWRLRRPAFDNDYAPEFFVSARSHHGALLKLRYLIENRKELGVLVGDHGLGKTYLTHVLEAELQSQPCDFIRLAFPLLSPGELLRYVAHRLGAAAGDTPVAVGADVVLARLEEVLQRRHDRRRILIIDDAHLLEEEHLQTLQLLLNLASAPNSVSLILLGRSDLLPRLKRVPPLADRAAVRCMLQPLTVDETRDYVAHRLRIAGADEKLLQPHAVQAAWELSRGVPRLLNQVCDLSLLVGYAEGLTSLSRVEVQAAAEELCAVSAD